MYDDEREPVVSASTRPLPYVQQGMALRHEHESSGVVWIVEDIYEDSHDATVIQLRHTDRDGIARRLVVPSAVCRAEYVLTRDFDPNVLGER
jgi:hypothetical protein